MDLSQTVLACEHLQKTFVDGDRRVHVLKEINFKIAAAQTVAILGSSGSGKSTLLHLLGGLDTPTSGQVFWENQAIHTFSEKKRCQLRNQYLGFVYQFHHLLPEFTAVENVAIPLLIRSEKPADALEQASILLDEVGLKERKSHRTTQLSGGERQRVAIARALVTKPRCVLADEPTGNLDEHTAKKVLETMLSLQQNLKTSFVVVTHNLTLAKQFQFCYSLANGELA